MQATPRVPQGGRGNSVEARRFFGRQVNGMGGRRTPRCASRAQREYRVRTGLELFFGMVRHETQGDGGRIQPVRMQRWVPDTPESSQWRWEEVAGVVTRSR